ncbi:4Fe-4S ferredoxin [Candidatus Thorarchaeota archaeon]|nr:MAG: 4Fe-4S ferredoxin [Candidatus Thorarchaeota archaeon]
MARPLWFVKLLKKTFPNRSLIAKATNVPLIGGLVDKIFFEGDDVIYLPKDSVAQKTIQIGRKLDKPEEITLPSEIVHHFIEKANKHWIMNSCICRDAATCKDYPIDYGCLFMGEAVDDINPHLGRLVTKEEAHDYVKKCREAGLVHLIGRNKLDAQWLGVSPGDKLLTVCNCCPCCCLWKMLPDLNPEIGRKITKMSGVEVIVTDACVGCGTCSEENVCFVNAISLIDGKAVISAECRGCGRCVEVCPEQAIELTINNPEFISESIDRVSSVVDVE